MQCKGLASSPSLCSALHWCGGNYKHGGTGIPQLTDFTFRSHFKFFLGALLVSELEIWLVYKAKKKRQAVEAASVSPARAEETGMLLYCQCSPHHSELLTISNSSTEAAPQSTFLGARFQVRAKAFWSALNCFI